MSDHWNKSRLHFHPFDPRSDLREIVQREPAFVGHVGVGEEGNVGDGVVADEEVVLREMTFHHFQRSPAAVAAGGENRSNRSSRSKRSNS